MGRDLVGDSKMTKVLVIDDDKDFVEQVRLGLTEYGCQVQVAENGGHGILVAKYDPPDLALVSLELPEEGGGIGVCKRIREAEHLRDVPIMVSSTSAFSASPELSAIVSDYVAKPVPIPDLIELMNALVPLNAKEQTLDEAADRFEDDETRIMMTSPVDPAEPGPAATSPVTSAPPPAVSPSMAAPPP
ncbi:MAG: hypothetical protein CVU63_16220, partial [Deltaproteobacteria bacterium HGW-Deltaproteobacteria-20]